MYTIEEIIDTFDWSYDQIRGRVLRLNDKIGDVFQRGSKNKILISEKGLSLLRKLSDLESSDKSIQNAIETISQDLQTPQSQEEKDISKDFKSNPNQAIEILKEQVEDLKQDKKRLQERNDTLEQRLLTGETEEKNKTEKLREELHQKEIELEKMKVQLEEDSVEKKDDFKELSLFQVVKKWFNTET